MTQEKFVDLAFAKPDIAREKRCGFSEVIYAPKKTIYQLRKIISELGKHTNSLFISHLDKSKFDSVRKYFPSLRYFPTAKIAFLGKTKRRKNGLVLVITAGTSDIDIAEEAAVFLELTGNNIRRIYDIGVAGVHRIAPFKKDILKANVIIVVAGMEAALTSIISGLAKCPVIGVPTSVGYGASFNGLSSLLGMLNCCALGVSVVNIDNGLGAGYIARLINLK